jgi:hypothetical protein
MSPARVFLFQSTGWLCVLVASGAAVTVLLIKPVSPAAWGAILSATVLVGGETVSGLTVGWTLDTYLTSLARAKRRASTSAATQAEWSKAKRAFVQVSEIVESEQVRPKELTRRVKRAKRRLARADFHMFLAVDDVRQLQRGKRRWLKAYLRAPRRRELSRSASLGLVIGPGIVAVWTASGGGLAVTATVAIVAGAARTASGERLNATKGSLNASSHAHQLWDDPQAREQAGHRVDELLACAQTEYLRAMATRACFVGTLGALVAVGIARETGLDLPFQLFACLATVVFSLLGAVRSALEEVDLPRRPDPIPIEFLSLAWFSGGQASSERPSASIRIVAEHEPDEEQGGPSK